MNTADWTALAAIGTAVMAIATFVLAVKTRSLARETKEVAQATQAMAKETKLVGEATLKEAQAVERQSEQVERQLVLSTDALRVSVQPWLVWEPSFEVRSGGSPMAPKHGVLYMQGTRPAIEAREKDDSVVGWFTVRNVGNGLAILDMSSSHIYPRNEQGLLEGVHPTVLSPVLAPGETVDIEFTIPATHSHDKQKMTLLQFAGGGVGNELFAVDVAYADSIGSAQTVAKFRAHRNQSDKRPWSIFEVEYCLPNGRVISTRRFG